MSAICKDVNLYFRKITDANGDVISERTMDFPDLADLDVEYTYDRNGNMTTLVRDGDDGIDLIAGVDNMTYQSRCT